MLRLFAHSVACCCAKFETDQTFQPTTPNISFGSVCTALPTLLGPRTRITHGLQSLMGCILSTMHCRSQHCWELLHLFAHHCQNVHNIVGATMFGSCCVRLHIDLPALLIDVRHSITIVFKSNAPALLPWYSIAYSPETCNSSIILHQNNIKFYTRANPC